MTTQGHEFSTRGKLFAAGLTLIATAGLAGCEMHGGGAAGSSTQTSAGGTETAGPGMEKVSDAQIQKDLGALAVKGPASMSGYSRDQFDAAGWPEVNGCDQRDNILRRDLTDTTLSHNGCEVLTGVLQDPYTGTTIHFKRGEGTSEAVEIDHVVALGDAWKTGAQQLSTAQRDALGIDPLELRAVSGPANVQKGDDDAASWLPSNKGDDCDYVAQQVLVKEKYDLWVTPTEHAAMENVLGACAGQEFVVPQS